MAGYAVLVVWLLGWLVTVPLFARWLYDKGEFESQTGAACIAICSGYAWPIFVLYLLIDRLITPLIFRGGQG
jgi:hypothetical protein